MHAFHARPKTHHLFIFLLIWPNKCPLLVINLIMASTSILHFLILTLFLLSTFHFSRATSRATLDLKTQTKQRPLSDSFTNLDEQMLLPAPLAGNKPMPTESLLPSFPTFLRPIIFPSPFGRFRPAFPFPTIPRFPPVPPTRDDSNLPSKPSVPLDQPPPPLATNFPGSPPIEELPWN